MALNVPGPVAVARAVADGAQAIKIEPPWGDPLSTLCPQWYDDLHRGIRVEQIDLKFVTGALRIRELFESADIFLASHRPAALARLRLDAGSLAADYPQLRHVNIVGDSANPEEPGHDVTYQARAGLIEDRLPRTLFADMAGAERAHAVLKEVMHHPGAVRVVGLFDALRDLAAPLHYGLTGPGRHLGGANPAYGIYATREGTIAVGALEPHFRERLFTGLGLPDGADPSEAFMTRTAEEWEQWAKQRDLPLVRC
jgi:crotonobetainyl-CoA:carnitine CoA-transferase CaiB-like acyl-CoA transferase